MADENCTITIFPTELADPLTGEPVTRWHWKRLTTNGAQIDGSGAQRNGLDTKTATLEHVKAKYPDDEITGA